jgi:uncharacterized membrane-anchored protein
MNKNYWAIGTVFIILGLILGLILLRTFQTKIGIYFDILFSLLVIFVGISFLQNKLKSKKYWIIVVLISVLISFLFVSLWAIG